MKNQKTAQAWQLIHQALQTVRGTTAELQAMWEAVATIERRIQPKPKQKPTPK